LAFLVPLDVDVFLSSFINFCLASNLLWSFLSFLIFQHIGRSYGNGGHFENSESSLHIYS
jgi:hypothetical protein